MAAARTFGTPKLRGPHPALADPPKLRGPHPALADPPKLRGPHPAPKTELLTWSYHGLSHITTYYFL